MWKHTGQVRPTFAIEPEPGQESVWDYPRPPRLEEDSRLIEVFLGEQRLVHSHRAFRLLETASPPTFYIPAEDVDMTRLYQSGHRSVCEWKGTAGYWNFCAHDDAMSPIAWSYERPNPAFQALQGCLCFYPSHVDAFVNGEHVQAQSSEFYGGWITREIVGPYKGEPGTSGW